MRKLFLIVALLMAMLFPVISNAAWDGGGGGGGGVHQFAASDPDANYDINDGVSIGDVAVNLTSDEVFVCADNSAGAAVWDSITEAAAGAASEDIQDAAGALFGGAGTETLITVTYQDATDDVDFVVDGDLANYTWTNVDDADIPDTITVGASGSVHVDALPVASGSTAGIAPTSSGVTDGWVLTVQADESVAWEASAAGVTDAISLSDIAITDYTAGNILIGDDSNSYDQQTVGGDATLAADGTLTISANAIEESMLKFVDAAADEAVMTYESTTGDFEWHTVDEIAAQISAGAITDLAVVENDLAASLAFDDGDLIDLSGITYENAAVTNEGLALPTYVAGAAPADGKPYIAYDASNNVIMVYEAGGWVDTSSASGASTTLNFVTTQAEGTLSSESLLNATSGSTGITVTDAGGDGGQITIALDTTEVDATTWSDNANATNVWTFDVSGTDHTMTAGDGVMTFGDAVTVTDTLTASNGLAVATTKNITVGVVQWDNGSDAIDGEVIADDTIDDDSIDLTDVTLNDLTFDVGSVDKTEFGFLNGMTGDPIQTQLDARALESVVGTSLNADDLTNNASVLELVAEIPHIDATHNWSADQEFQDGIPISFGNDNDFEVSFDTDISGDDGGDNDFAAGALSGAALKIAGSSASDINILVNNAGTGGSVLYVDQVVANSIAAPTGATGDSYIALANNSGGLAPSGYRLYFETDGSDVLSYSLDGSEKRVANLEDAQTISGAKTFSYDIIFNEAADHQSTPGAGKGYLWVKSDTPSSLIFTDDAGTDYDLTASASGDIESVGDAASGAALDGSSDGGTYIRLYDGDSHYGEFQVPDVSGNVTYTFPATTETIASLEGSDTQVIFNNGGTTYAGDAGFVFNATTDTLTLGEDGVDGKLVLFNDGGTDYNLTLQPGTQSSAATITFPGATGTLATLGNAETFSGIKTFSARPVFSAGITVADAGNIGSASDTDAIAIAANGVVTFSQIPVLPANSIDSDAYVDGSIDTAHIAADQITGALIADDQIDSEHYVAASIDNEHLADDAVGTAELADDAVNMDRIDEDSDYTDFTGNIATTGYMSGGIQPVTVGNCEGVHDGGANAATLSDSGESLTVDAYIGMTLYNTTDGSSGVITDNDATTITATLAGGTDNDWDVDDAWSVGPGPKQSGVIFYITAATTILHPATAGYVAMYYSTGANTVSVDPASGSMQFTLDGTATGTNGEELDSAGAAGDFITIHNVSATVGRTLGRSGTWTDGGES
jgi:hypothetical protein